MANVFDYLQWRGDLSLGQSPFDDVDALIMTCLAYHFFDRVLTPYDSTPVSICDVAKRVKELPKEDLHMRDPQDVILVQKMAESPRYCDMGLCYYVDHIDEDKEEQFAAVTVLLGDGTAFVAYRGTDLSLVGWKEDFNMSLMDVVPAQIAAGRYLLFVSEQLDCPLYVGGHSKGGNLAVFASAVSPAKVQGRILCIYNNDGPGFQKGMLQFQGYQEILPRVHTFVPQSSVIGLLLGHEGDYVVVKSDQKGIMQHDPYSWEVLGREFVCLESVTAGSKFLDRALKSWLKNLIPEQREKFINSLFELLSIHHTDDHGEIVITPKSALLTLQSLQAEDEESRNAILHGLYLLWTATWETAGVYGGALQKLAEQKLKEGIK